MNAKIRLGMAAALALAIAPAYADESVSNEGFCERPYDITSLQPAGDGCPVASWVGGGYDVIRMEAVLSEGGSAGPARDAQAPEPDERLLQIWMSP